MKFGQVDYHSKLLVAYREGTFTKDETWYGRRSVATAVAAKCLTRGAVASSKALTRRVANWFLFKPAKKSIVFEKFEKQEMKRNALCEVALFTRS